MTRNIVLATATLALFGMSEAAAQQTTSDVTATLSVSEVLSMSATGATSLNFVANTPSHFSGIHVTPTNGVPTTALRTTANVAHRIQVQATTANFTPSGNARSGKPSSDLHVRLVGDATWLPVPSTANTFLQATNLVPGDHTSTVEYRLALDWQDQAGQYDLTVRYTVIAQ
jgi:hypothetical protein